MEEEKTSELQSEGRVHLARQPREVRGRGFQVGHWSFAAGSQVQTLTSARPVSPDI